MSRLSFNDVSSPVKGTSAGAVRAFMLGRPVDPDGGFKALGAAGASNPSSFMVEAQKATKIPVQVIARLNTVPLARDAAELQQEALAKRKGLTPSAP